MYTMILESNLLMFVVLMVMASACIFALYTVLNKVFIGTQNSVNRLVNKIKQLCSWNEFYIIFPIQRMEKQKEEQKTKNVSLNSHSIRKSEKSYSKKELTVMWKYMCNEYGIRYKPEKNNMKVKKNSDTEGKTPDNSA